MSAPAFTKDALQLHVQAGRLVVGPNTYGAPILRYWGAPAGYVCRIGDYCSIADNVQIFLGGYHRPDWVSMYPFPAFPDWPEARGRTGHAVGRGDVTIGSDVWLSSHCTLMSGVTIGHGAVVAAQAVVSRDVPPYAIVAGNPARVVKHRFDDTTISDMLRIAWWDWPRERIRENMDLLLSGDISSFIAHNGGGPAST